MTRRHKISIGDREFLARSGERLLDAAMARGVELPHDCRAGRCGSCMVKVASGITLGGETHQRGLVYACQALVFSDLRLEIEPRPPVVRIGARVREITEMAKDIVEVVLAPDRQMPILAGQYCQFRFRGFPSRPFSPTAAMDGSDDDGYIRLHIKRVRDGQVTPHLGGAIGRDHRVTIEGPHGHAFLRPRQSQRIVAIGSGTGFAPVWSVASAALRENAARKLVLLGASRWADAFYMGPALRAAAQCPDVRVCGVVEEADGGEGLLSGRVIDHLPDLHESDVVYAAGAPKLVEAVGERAAAAGATFYADPFAPAGGPPGRNWIASAKAWISAE